jgi:hypothetical protein
MKDNMRGCPTFVEGVSQHVHLLQLFHRRLDADIDCHALATIPRCGNCVLVTVTFCCPQHIA